MEIEIAQQKVVSKTPSYEILKKLSKRTVSKTTLFETPCAIKNRKFKSVLLLLLFLQMALAMSAQTDVKGYKNTRRLLSNMHKRADKSLKKLFEQASERWTSLVAALYDDDDKVSVNAQKVLLYLATPEAIEAIETWRTKCVGKKKRCYSPNMHLVTETVFLEGDDADVEKLILRNKRLLSAFNFNDGQARVRFIARHKASDTVLLELVEGKLFTSGWRASIRQEGGRWRLLSDDNIWVH